MKNLYTVLVLAGHLLEASAETLPSLSCAAGSEVTAHPECDSFLSSNDACATVMDRPGKEDCLCHQEYLDSLSGCENELRLCYRREDLGVNFDRARELWNSLCGSVITFDPTTAPPSSYEPYPDQLCKNIKTRCAEARKLLRECTDYTSDKDTSKFSSCTCRPTLLREAYSCASAGFQSGYRNGVPDAGYNNCNDWFKFRVDSHGDDHVGQCFSEGEPQIWHCANVCSL
ncbi:hypothetical protein FALCPG4_008726 [Fusarium falciforme]